MSIFSVLAIVAEFTHLTLESKLLLVVIFGSLLEFHSLDSFLLVELTLSFFKLLCLLLNDLRLSIQHELLSFDFKRLLAQLVECSIEISFHLRILCLEQIDVLVARLVVVVETTYA